MPMGANEVGSRDVEMLFLGTSSGGLSWGLTREHRLPEFRNPLSLTLDCPSLSKFRLFYNESTQIYPLVWHLLPKEEQAGVADTK